MTEWVECLVRGGVQVSLDSHYGDVVGNMKCSWVRWASWVPGHRVRSFVFNTQDVYHVETLANGLLFKVSEPYVRDVFEASIAKDFK